MNFQFNLPDFPESSFEMETFDWSSKLILLMNGKPVEQSKEKGKPFLIPTKDGEIVQAFPKPNFLGYSPTLLIDGIKNKTSKKMPWYDTFLSIFPVILIVYGGLIGGLFGGIGIYLAVNILKNENKPTIKYLKVLGVIIGIFLTFIGFEYLLVYLIK
jgi:hypothetical protein